MNDHGNGAPQAGTVAMAVRGCSQAVLIVSVLALTAAPAWAIDLTKISGLGGEGWTTKSATPELVQLSCTSPVCPPAGQLAIASRPAPDAARDEVIDDPQGSLAGYRKGFEKSSVAQACSFENFRAQKVGETGARIEMDGDCPSGLVVMMATIFDKSQGGSISVVASSQDRAKAARLRDQTVASIDGAIGAAR
ncbi:hypothetical protein IHQ68_17030 [Chelatococcus sambhunathii]|uniref:Uncharacterized protein n=1 Tax=Chelatococcus sambhunathii TaxID=363953 RepID=A0ABU1DJL0_9HYPH|nr:hypothetical protein [Chelatococcus sambhunathii]MDR4308324.1 hypothetical protein [Chelatococcus sambhunathii]